MEPPSAPGKRLAVTPIPPSVEKMLAAMAETMNAQMEEFKEELKNTKLKLQQTELKLQQTELELKQTKETTSAQMGELREELKSTTFDFQLTKDKFFSSENNGELCDWNSEWNQKIPSEWEKFIFEGAPQPTKQSWETICALFAALTRRTQWLMSKRRLEHARLDWLEKQFHFFDTKSSGMEGEIAKMKETLSLPVQNTDGTLRNTRPMTTIEAEKLRHELEKLKDGNPKLIAVQKILGHDNPKSNLLEVNLEKVGITQLWKLHFLLNNLTIKRRMSSAALASGKKVKPLSGVTAAPLSKPTSFADPLPTHDLPALRRCAKEKAGPSAPSAVEEDGEESGEGDPLDEFALGGF